MLQMTVVIVENLVLRKGIKFKASQSGAGDCNVTVRISKAD